MKKYLAVALSGMLVFGAGMSVYAADAEENEVAVATTNDESLGSLIGNVMNSLGSDEGGLSDIISSLGSEEDGAVGMLGNLFGSLGSEEGELNSLLDNVIGGFSWAEIKEKGLNLIYELSQGDLASFWEALNEPGTLDMVSSLFAKEGLATTILDMISSKGTALGTVVGTMKGEEGGYDVERIIRSLEGAEEKEDSIVIDGTEISVEEIREAATQIMELFGLTKDGD